MKSRFLSVIFIIFFPPLVGVRPVCCLCWKRSALPECSNMSREPLRPPPPPPLPPSSSHPSPSSPSALRVELHAGPSRSHTLLRRTAPRETTTLHVGKHGGELRHARTWLDLSAAARFASSSGRERSHDAEHRWRSIWVTLSMKSTSRSPKPCYLTNTTNGV